MKHVFAFSLAAVATVWMLGAEDTFSLQFPEKTLKPKAKSTGMVKKISVRDENFTKVSDGKFAFALSDVNAKKQEYPNFSATQNFNFAAGSAEFTFKQLKPVMGSCARLLHVYSPAKDNSAVLIYYFFLGANGDFRGGVQLTAGGKSKNAQIRIPEAEMAADAFQTIKVTWDDKLLCGYLNGKKLEEVELPPEFAAEIKKERGWSSMGVLPVYPDSGDLWTNRIAISDLKITDEAK